MFFGDVSAGSGVLLDTWMPIEQRLGETGFVDHGDQSQAGRRRPWAKVSWWYSLILPAAILLFIVNLAFDRLGSDPAVSGVVTDAYTGEPVAGVRVATGATAVETDNGGHFSFDTPLSGSLSVSRDDYESTQVPVQPTDEKVAISIRPTTLSGVVTNVRSNEPVVGATITVSSPDRESVKTATDEDGRYLLFDVPSNATITVSHPGLTTITQPVNQSTVLDFDVRPDVISGFVLDEAGLPVAEARVELGEVSATTDADGAYRLAGVPDEGQISIRRAGYREVVADYPEDLIFNATLERFLVKAVYVSALTASDDEQWGEILDLIDGTELNAVVLDVKDSSGLIRYDSDIQLAQEVGAVDPVFDLESRLEDLKSREIYAIARLVVFEDPVLATGRPDLAIKDLDTGEPWTTWDGRTWVNVMDETVWNYNTEIALEAAAAGFDEIQLDYVRFPTEGPVEVADYGAPVTAESRQAAISAFLEGTRAAIGPTGAALAIDVAGTTLWDEGDNGIGQDLEAIVPLVDVVNPVLFPSSFPPGTFGFDFPNDHPFSVIEINMERIQERFRESAFKFRPWLQDFSSGLGINYGVDEVRAQIDAAEQYGEAGWMLWNDANVYTLDALAIE